MSLKFRIWNALTILAIFMAYPIVSARAQSLEVCPTHSNDKVKGVDIFDGKPEELAYLAPDENKALSSIFALGYVYDEGRTVTVRCKYKSGSAIDVDLINKINQCIVSLQNDKSIRILCH